MAILYEIEHPNELINCENYSENFETIDYTQFLSTKEKSYLTVACYPKFYYITMCMEYVTISKYGIFKVNDSSNSNDILQQVDGKNIEEVLKLMGKNGSLEDADNIKMIIRNFKLQTELKE